MLKKLLVRMWAAFTTYQERRAMYIMLNTLTAKQIQDMGMSKDAIQNMFGPNK